MEKFEYKTIVVRDRSISMWGLENKKGDIVGKEFEKDINELGSQGWELVNVIPLSRSISGQQRVCYQYSNVK